MDDTDNKPKKQSSRHGNNRNKNKKSRNNNDDDDNNPSTNNNDDNSTNNHNNTISFTFKEDETPLEVESLFESLKGFGLIKKIKIQSGYGHLEFKKDQSVEKVLSYYNNETGNICVVDGKLIKLKRSTEQEYSNNSSSSNSSSNNDNNNIDNNNNYNNNNNNNSSGSRNNNNRNRNNKSSKSKSTTITTTTNINNKDLNELFYLVWHNKVIRDIIFNQVKIYNIHGSSKFDNITSIYDYEYKEYLYEAVIDISKELVSVDCLNKKVPKRIESLGLTYKRNTRKDAYRLPKLPEYLESLVLYTSFNLTKSSFQYSKCLKTLHVTQITYSRIDNGVLPDSITDLTLNYPFYITKGLLPKSLIKLYIDNFDSDKTDMDHGALPSGLKEFKIIKLMKGMAGDLPNGLLKFNATVYFEVPENFFPDSITDLSIKFDLQKVGANKYLRYPPQLESLTINKDYYNDLASYGQLPNVKKLKVIVGATTDTLYTKRRGQIQHVNYIGTMPSGFEDLTIPIPTTVQAISISTVFNYRIPNELFVNLRYLKVIEFGYSFNNGNLPFFNGRVFPESLEHISFGDKFDQAINLGTFYKASNGGGNLKSIKFGWFFRSVNFNPSYLPESITSIDNPTVFDRYLRNPDRQLPLPSELEVLSTKVDPIITSNSNVLSSLKTLVLGPDYDFMNIKDLSIFTQLETLKVYSIYPLRIKWNPNSNLVNTLKSIKTVKNHGLLLSLVAFNKDNNNNLDLDNIIKIINYKEEVFDF